MLRGLVFCIAATALLTGAGCGGAANSAQSPLSAGLTETGRASTDSVPPPATTQASQPNSVAAMPPACGATPLATVSLCDTFETQAPGDIPDPNRWSLQLTDANDLIEVSASQAAQGNQSLHVHVSGTGYQRVTVMPKSMIPLTDDGFFGRMFVMSPDASPTDPVTLFAAGGMVATGPVWLRGGTQQNVLALTYVGSGQSLQSSAGLTAGRWTCLEWQMDGSTSAVRVWVDGSESPSLEVGTAQGWQAPTFDRLQVGWERAAATGEARDIYFDSLAFGSARLGCK